MSNFVIFIIFQITTSLLSLNKTASVKFVKTYLTNQLLKKKKIKKIYFAANIVASTHQTAEDQAYNYKPTLSVTEIDATVIEQR